MHPLHWENFAAGMPCVLHIQHITFKPYHVTDSLIRVAVAEQGACLRLVTWKSFKKERRITSETEEARKLMEVEDPAGKADSRRVDHIASRWGKDRCSQR